MHRRTLAAAGLGAASLALPGRAARAQGWPDRPIRMFVAYPAGLIPDVLGRLLAQPLSASLGRPVVVENAAGAAGNIGTDRVAKAAPDGYTIGLTSNGPLTLSPTSTPNLPFNVARDLAPITPVASTPTALMVYPGLPANTLQELLALARAKPGELSFSHTGIGNSTHIAGELMKKRAGVDIISVPYSTSLVPDVMAGRVSMTFGSVNTALPLVRDGKLKCLGVTSRERLASAPDFPTFSESGLPDFEVLTWFGLVAPARTPEAVVNRLHAETSAALTTLRLRIQELGAEPMSETPAAFTARIAAETRQWAPVLRDIGAVQN
ncbi:Bug family tripartite tricarboxylate transporter substrate binding protein [Roseomonas sp. BN140053]|uniref:Bug family tripartite tricarboxylate transporter substrate binding protein n=1 Tax=Roseomonas sp. BN140053 TaxID=3391898 RepID=UPI0039E7C348